MNMTTYLNDSARTIAETFFANLVPLNVLRTIIDVRLDSSPAVDSAKKALFYGRRSERFHRAVHETLKMDPDLGDYDGIDRDIIHAILGMDSEVAELMELLDGYLMTGFIDRKKLIDEAGDLQWYQALLYRKIATTFEEVGERNLAKLQARYPDKFSTEQAIHRNEEAESRVFQ